MTSPATTLAQHAADVADVWAGALPPSWSGNPVPDLDSASDSGLLRLCDVIARVRRDTDALLCRVAGEIARRSSSESGREALAKAAGFGSPARLVAAATGGSVGEASKLIAVGNATATRPALSGGQLPPRHAHVAQALNAGAISTDAANSISRMLDRVALRSDPEQRVAVEAILAERAPDIPLDVLHRIIGEAEARLDQDGVAPREDELRARRALTMRSDRDGMLHFRGVLEAESAALVKAAIESLVTATLQRRCGDDSQPVAPAVEGDRRSIPQLQADALVLIARHALGCDRVPSASPISLVIRADVDALRHEIGHATIDGVDGNLSAGSVRRLAASADIIPAVLGGSSVPLDLGRTARLFSPAQRIALAERDGGCASCGLAVSYVEAHHIRWWMRDSGPTNLHDGVMLCPDCHRRIHHDGWTVRVTDDQVWFIPPPHVDPDQVPRLGGRARFGLPDAA